MSTNTVPPVRTSVLLEFFGKKPVLRKVTVDLPPNIRGATADLTDLKLANLPQAIASALVFFRMHDDLVAFRIETKKLTGTFIHSILKAKEEGLEKMGPVRALAAGSFMRLFKGDMPKNEGAWLEMDLQRIQPKDVLIQYDGRQVDGEANLAHLAEAVAATRSWELADYRVNANGARPANEARSANNIERDIEREPIRHSAPSAEYDPIELEREYEALSRSYSYERAAALACKVLDRPNLPASEAAKWAARAGSAYRRQGKLFSASKSYAKAAQCIVEAQHISPEDLEIQYLAGQIEFGQIIVDDYMRHSRYGVALTRHNKLAENVEELIASSLPESPLRILAQQRRPHIFRQQGETLRYMGRYREAKEKAVEAAALYSEWAHEANAYAALSLADCLRMLGEFVEALAIYGRLEQNAKGRKADGLLCSLLWRRAELEKAQERLEDAKRSIAELEEVVSDRAKTLGYAKLYLLLASIPIEITSGNFDEVDRMIAEGRTAYHLSENYMRAEFAHTLLFEGEVLRRRNQNASAADLFKKAGSLYLGMPQTWGVVRSTIGLLLTGSRTALPNGVTPEGFDAKILTYSVSRKEGRCRLERLFLSNFP